MKAIGILPCWLLPAAAYAADEALPPSTVVAHEVGATNGNTLHADCDVVSDGKSHTSEEWRRMPVQCALSFTWVSKKNIEGEKLSFLLMALTHDRSEKRVKAFCSELSKTDTKSDAEYSKLKAACAAGDSAAVTGAAIALLKGDAIVATCKDLEKSPTSDIAKQMSKACGARAYDLAIELVFKQLERDAQTCEVSTMVLSSSQPERVFKRIDENTWVSKYNTGPSGECGMSTEIIWRKPSDRSSWNFKSVFVVKPNAPDSCNFAGHVQKDRTTEYRWDYFAPAQVSCPYIEVR